MIFSQQQIFSDAQAITATADSENVIDLGVRGTPYGAAAALHGDKGVGNKVPLLAQIVETFNNLTTLKIAVETGSTTGLGTEIMSVTVALADLVAGYQVPFDVLPNMLTERYLGLVYTVVGTAPAAGKVTSGITMGNQTNTTGA